MDARETVLVDYGPHFKPDGRWELHLQNGPGSSRYKFHGACSSKNECQAAAETLSKTFRSDTTIIVADDRRRVVAVKFIFNEEWAGQITA